MKTRAQAIEFMLAHIRKHKLSLVNLYNFRVFECESGIYVHLSGHNCCESLQDGLSYYFKNRVKK